MIDSLHFSWKQSETPCAILLNPIIVERSFETDVLSVEELIPILFAIGIALSIAWFVARPPAVFVVQVRDRRMHATHGKVTDGFLAAIAEMCREFDFQG